MTDNFMRWEEELDERLSISDRFGISIGFMSVIKIFTWK